MPEARTRGPMRASRLCRIIADDGTCVVIQDILRVVPRRLSMIGHPVQLKQVAKAADDGSRPGRNA